MTVAKCKSIALQLANAYWVRYWVCLNYPHEPQAVCIQVKDANGRVVQFHDFGEKEILKAGFEFKERFGIWGYHADVTAEDGGAE